MFQMPVPLRDEAGFGARLLPPETKKRRDARSIPARSLLQGS